MFHVIKRNGDTADFTLTKINDVIMKAFNATGMEFSNDIIDLLALRVTADFQDKVKAVSYTHLDVYKRQGWRRR